ncbi:MAG: porin family protein [Paludibacter sp.]|nr:porin family protein [Paludibacter sp.]
MKKILSILLFILFAIQTNAQVVEFPLPKIDVSKIDVSKIDFSFLNFDQFSFGVKVSPSIDWMKVNHDDMQADGATLKFGIAGIADYALNKNISVVSGVNFNGFGGYVFDNKSLNDVSTKDNYMLNYSQLEIPMCLKLKTTELKKVSYFIQGGLNTGFIITANEKHQNINKNIPSSPVDIYPITNPSRLGYQFSVGSELYITKKLKFFTEICYKNSMTNVALSDNYISSGKYDKPIELIPGSMEFSVGLMFK